MNIVGIAGSLRKGSFNKALLQAAVTSMPTGHTLHLASIDDVPLYHGDEETAHGTPPSVARLRAEIAAAHGLLLVTPEYNGSIPGVFKNAMDWISRPAKDNLKVFDDKPVAVMGATPGMGGTRLAQAAWLPVLRNLGTHPWCGKQLYVSNASHVFDAEGTLIDAKVKLLLGEFMAGFTTFVSAMSQQS